MSDALDQLKKDIQSIRGFDDTHKHKWKNQMFYLWTCYCGAQRFYVPPIMATYEEIIEELNKT